MIIDYDPKIDEIRRQNQAEGKDTAIIDAIVNIYNVVNGHLDDSNIVAKSLGSFNIKGGEDWHTVGATGEPAFQNSWVNYGGSYAGASFMKDSLGFVHLRGMVKSGQNTDDAIFTLPAGYRPAAQEYFVYSAANAYGDCMIDTSGNVRVETGSNVWASLSGITFRAEL